MKDSRSSRNTIENESDRLLVFSDDWGRHPSSCQHLIRQILPSVPVTWVNTIGMRPPRLDWLTVRRGAGKIAGWMKPAAKNGAASVSLPSGLSVVDAKMWPWMSRRHDRWINRQLLASQLSAVAQDAVAITTIPIVVDWIDVLPARRWVYYCVDDFSVWPGLDGKTLGRMEDDLLPKMDVIIAASETLAESIRDRGHQCEVLTHGVDLDFWSSECRDELNSSSPVASAPIRLTKAGRGESNKAGPQILFWGVVDRRLNAEWVLSLANSMSRGMISLAGPQQDPDPKLREHSRISMPGPVPFESLPALAQQADVLIMPYADLPVTRAMQPLKLKEYLATGLPVVASSLPAVREWSDCLEMVDDESAFIASVQSILDADGEVDYCYTQRRQDRLSSESWKKKSEQFFHSAVKNCDHAIA